MQSTTAPHPGGAAPTRTGTQLLRVVAARYEADGVLGLDLAAPDGGDLPPWRPGDHVDLELPSGAVRSYSLCGDPAERAVYRLAVLRDDTGRGASRELHTVQLVGRTLPVRGPAGGFDLVDAAAYRFVAGGIGITPLLPMLTAATDAGRPWSLHYLGRTRASMAFVAPVLAAAAAAVREGVPAVVEIVARDERPRLDLAAALAGTAPDEAVYCCGPTALLEAVEALPLPPGSLHLERFGRPGPARPADASGPADVSGTADASGTGGPADAGRTADMGDAVGPHDAVDPDGPFTLELARSGVTLEVGPGQSVLERVRTVRQGLSFSCSDGYCGTCETAVLAGVPDHRDSVLSDDERAANATMMICVGRSRTARLVLDL